MRPLKSILITGATSGIGRHAAVALAKRGHFVFATGRREDRLAELAEECKNFDLRIVPLDVNDPASVDKMYRQVERLTGHHGIQVVVNNAGYGQPGAMELLTDEELHAQFDTNVVGLMRVTRKFLPRMRERGEGRIINISSVVGHFSFPFLGAYCASKYAVEAISDAMRLELRPFGVKVILVEPGSILTEFRERNAEKSERFTEEDNDYTELMKSTRGVTGDHASKAPDPSCITKALMHAIEAKRPKIRYMTPMRDRLLVRLHKIMPTAIVDAIVASKAKLNPK